MQLDTPNCKCLMNEPVKPDDVIHFLKELRLHCSVLEKIIIPDEIWPDYQEKH